jgi:hypothetical protein
MCRTANSKMVSQIHLGRSPSWSPNNERFATWVWRAGCQNPRKASYYQKRNRIKKGTYMNCLSRITIKMTSWADSGGDTHRSRKRRLGTTRTWTRVFLSICLGKYSWICITGFCMWELSIYWSCWSPRSYWRFLYKSPLESATGNFSMASPS